MLKVTNIKAFLGFTSLPHAECVMISSHQEHMHAEIGVFACQKYRYWLC